MRYFARDKLAGWANQAFLISVVCFSLAGCTKHEQAESFDVTDRLQGLWARDAAQVWAVGEEGSILHSADGGEHWRSQKSGAVEQLFSIWGSNSQLWAVGATGAILHSADGGDRWQPQKSGTDRQLASVYAIGLQVWAVGERGTILYSVNGGKDWQSKTSGTKRQLYSIYATGSQVWAVGDDGTVPVRGRAG